MHPFDVSEGTEFLQSLLPGFDTQFDVRVDDLTKIATVFGGLPLALKQIAGHWGESRTNFLDVVNRLEIPEQIPKIFAEIPCSFTLDRGFTTLSVPTTTMASLDEGARNILGVLSILCPDGIHDRILRCICSHFGLNNLR